MNQIMQSFANLDDGDRQTTMKALSTMMRDEKQAQSPKKKVNGFIGYRCEFIKQMGENFSLMINDLPAYYSALFSQLQQKQRSPFMTKLWQQDAFHGEWDLMCGTYSTIRSLLTQEKVTLQVWISYAVGPLGIVARDHYMAAMGWTMAQQDDGTYKLERTGEPMVERSAQLMSGLNLLMQCLKNGLPVANPQPMIAALSNRSGDVMCVKTSGTAGRPKPKPKPQAENDDPLLAMAKDNPALAMSRLFEIPVDHPWFANGVQVFEIGSLNDLTHLPAGAEVQRRRDELAPARAQMQAQTQASAHHDVRGVHFDAAMNHVWDGQRTAQAPGHVPQGFFDVGATGQPISTGYSSEMALQQVEAALFRDLYPSGN